MFVLFSLFCSLIFLKIKQAVTTSPRYLETHVVVDKALVSLCIPSAVNRRLQKNLVRAAGPSLHKDTEGSLHQA